MCKCGGYWQLWSFTHWTKAYPGHPERKVGYQDLYKCQQCGNEEWVPNSPKEEV